MARSERHGKPQQPVLRCPLPTIVDYDVNGAPFTPNSTWGGSSPAPQADDSDPSGNVWQGPTGPNTLGASGGTDGTSGGDVAKQAQQDYFANQQWRSEGRKLPAMAAPAAAPVQFTTGGQQTGTDEATGEQTAMPGAPQTYTGTPQQRQMAQNLGNVEQPGTDPYEEGLRKIYGLPPKTVSYTVSENDGSGLQPGTTVQLPALQAAQMNQKAKAQAQTQQLQKELKLDTLTQADDHFKVTQQGIQDRTQDAQFLAQSRLGIEQGGQQMRMWNMQDNATLRPLNEAVTQSQREFAAATKAIEEAQRTYSASGIADAKDKAKVASDKLLAAQTAQQEASEKIKGQWDSRISRLLPPDPTTQPAATQPAAPPAGWKPPAGAVLNPDGSYSYNGLKYAR